MAKIKAKPKYMEHLEVKAALDKRRKMMFHGTARDSKKVSPSTSFVPLTSPDKSSINADLVSNLSKEYALSLKKPSF